MREDVSEVPWWAEGYDAAREVDRGWITLAPLTFGRGRVALWTVGGGALEHW